tara:strand:+ start:5252 stop:5716 length:465 start_codon:yes stop_codon:yes gene_type:complete
MARITCRTPSTGKAIRASIADVQTTFSDLSEAPDFSVPDTSNKYSDRDPLDITRAIRPGEHFFLTPMSAKNKDTVDRWVEVQLIEEDGTIIEFGRTTVPPGDTVFIPLQGRSIFKRNPLGGSGDVIQVRAETASMFDVWATLEEKLSSEHSGVV